MGDQPTIGDASTADDIPTTSDALDMADTSTMSEMSDTVACDAVMATYEVLENIIAQSASTSGIYNAKLVCKTWYQTITRSKTIRRAAVLKPQLPGLSRHDEAIWGFQGTTSCPCPLYNAGTSGIKMRLNPALQKCKILKSLQITGEVMVSLDQSGKGALSVARSCFATLPPCTAIGVMIERYPRCGIVTCVVYVRDGVTIGDLLDIATAIEGQDRHWGYHARRSLIRLAMVKLGPAGVSDDTLVMVADDAESADDGEP